MEDVKLRLFRAQSKKKDAEESLFKEAQDLEKIKVEIKNRPHLAMTVSDHALVMYYKRVLNEDFTKKVTEILNLCDNAELQTERNKGDGKIEYIYEIEGPNNTMLKLIVVDNTIVTCYVNEKDNGKQI